MAKASKRRRSNGKAKKAGSPVERFIRPTEAREAHNDFHSAGVAVKVIPPIKTMLQRGNLSQRQFDGLSRYADVANAAERSPIKDSCDFSVTGSGEGLPHFGVRKNIELGELERALGALRDIAHAICVREISVSQWAMERHGSVMRERQASGRKVVRWYEPKRMMAMCAMMEIQEAGDRLARQIGV